MSEYEAFGQSGNNNNSQFRTQQPTPTDQRRSPSGGAELRSERSFSLPPPDCPKPPRRRTLEYPSATSSRKNSDESSSLLDTPFGATPSSYYTAYNSYDPGSFWNPHTDHPLSLSEQQDVLDRIRNDLLGVNLESIKGPLRQLASLGDNAPAMNADLASPVVADPPNSVRYQTSTPGATGATADRKTTVSPQEAFLDYDDTVKKAPVNLFGSIPSPPLPAVSNARSLPHSATKKGAAAAPSTASTSSATKQAPAPSNAGTSSSKKGQSFSVPENAVSWRNYSYGANSNSSSADDEDVPTPPMSASGPGAGKTVNSRTEIAPTDPPQSARPSLTHRSSTSSSSQNNTGAAPSPKWDDWTSGPVPPPLPGFAPPPPPRSMQLQYPSIGASAAFAAPAPPAHRQKKVKKVTAVPATTTATRDDEEIARRLDEDAPAPRRARLAATRKFTDYDLGDDSTSSSGGEGGPATAPRASTSASQIGKGAGEDDEFADVDAEGEDDYFEDDEDDEDFGGRGDGGTSSSGKRKRRGSGSGGSPRKRQHGAHPSHSAGDIVCQVVDAQGVPCGTVFRRPYDLNRHMATIHGVGGGPKKEWKCRVCETVFSRKDALIRHTRTSKHRNPV